MQEGKYLPCSLDIAGLYQYFEVSLTNFTLAGDTSCVDSLLELTELLLEVPKYTVGEEEPL